MKTQKPIFTNKLKNDKMYDKKGVNKKWIIQKTIKD